MSIVQAIALGILQGISEFIPISSSGHLVIARHLMGLGEVPILFDVILHIATLIVIVHIFRDRIIRILVSLWRGGSRIWRARILPGDGKTAKSAGRGGDPPHDSGGMTALPQEDLVNLRLARLVIIATVLTAVLGLGIAELDLARFPKLVSALFIVTGVVLMASRFLHGTLDYHQIGTRHAVITGIAQGISVLPGISRSGITITAALATGIDRSRAGEFSFLISVPAVLGALVLTLRDLGDLRASVSLPALAAGFVASLVAGYVALILLLRLIRGGKLYLFAFYLIPLGILGLLLL